MSGSDSVYWVILSLAAAHVVTMLQFSECAWHSCSATGSASICQGASRQLYCCVREGLHQMLQGLQLIVLGCHACRHPGTASAFPLSGASPADAFLPHGLAGLGGSSLTPVQVAALHSGLSLTASLEDGTAGHGLVGSMEQLSGSTWPLLLPGPARQPLVMATLPGPARCSAGAGAAAEQDEWSETSDPEAVVQSMLLAEVRACGSTCWRSVRCDGACNCCWRCAQSCTAGLASA